VARRLADRDVLATANEAAIRQTSFPETVRWDPCSIAQGDAGLALAFAHFDSCLPGEGWDAVAHRSLVRAAAEAERRGLTDIGLFSGLSGLGLAAWALSRGGTRYQRLLSALDEALVPEAVARSRALATRTSGVSVHEFDAISGVSGVGAYLLRRREVAGAASALDAVLSSLVALTAETAGPPRWHTPQLLSHQSMVRDFPGGNLNCGLAHGIPGPLALMALALLAGVKVAGLQEAVERVATWLAEHRADDHWGVNWPTAIPLDAQAVEARSRTAWCYGTPGVARAVWLAGTALDDQALCGLAVRAMEAVYRRPHADRGIDSPTFCHGIAGLLQITLRFASDTGLPLFTQMAEGLIDELLAAYKPECLLGFEALDPAGVAVENAGLLDGAAGVALVLLAAAVDVEPRWDRLFLLS
jgi:hypothetical protein